MDKAIAFTYASNDIAYYFAERVQRSFEYFHKDVPFKIITLEDELPTFDNVMRPKHGSHWAALSIRMLNHFKDRYEVVIKLDSDLVVTNRLDEFLDNEYDVATTMNVKGISDKWDEYYNLGLVAVRSKQFAEEWFRLTYDPKFIYEMNFGYLEQDVMNFLAHDERYKCLVVDKEGPYYNETSREFWHDIKVRHKGLFIGDRQVKAMHWAGGGEIKNKYSHPAFSEEVCKYLDKLTGTTDFTDGKKKYAEQAQGRF